MRKRLTWTERLFLVFCGLLTAGAAVFCVCTQPKSMAEEFYNYLDMAYIREICIVTPGSRYTDNPAPDCAALLEQLSVLDFPGHRREPVFRHYTIPEENLPYRIFRIAFKDSTQILLNPEGDWIFVNTVRPDEDWWGKRDYEFFG